MLGTKIKNPLGEGRNAGIDLLRLCAMFMVVLFNCAANGGILSSVSQFSSNGYILMFIDIATKCAINCFGLITGFVCVNAKHKSSRLFPLWLEAFLYSWGITVVLAIANPNTVTRKELLLSFIPILNNEYSYFTAYFCLFFFIPILNMLIHRLGGKQNTFLVAVLVALFCGVSVVGRYTGSELGICGGQSPLWLGVLYYIGAYLNIYGERLAKKLSKIRCIVGFVAAAGIGLAVKILLVRNGVDYRLGMEISDILANYNSPLIVLAAVFLLMLFAGVKLGKLSKIVSRLSADAFGVYLISCQHIFVKKFIFGKFSALSGDAWWAMAGKLLLGALIIFALCLAVDIVRSLLFKILPVRRICAKIDSLARNRLPAQPF